MKTTVKAFVSTALVLVLGTAAAMANPQNMERKAPADGEKIERVERNHEARKPDLDKIYGVINVTGKQGNRIVTITTAKKKTFVLNTVSMPKRDKAPVNRAEAENQENGTEKAKRPEMGQREPRMKKFIDMETLASKKGKKVALVGFMNKESSVFTAVDFFHSDSDLEK